MDRKRIRDRIAAIGGPVLIAWALVGPGLILWQQHEQAQLTQRVHTDEQVVIPFATYLANFDHWDATTMLGLCHTVHYTCSVPPSFPTRSK